LLAHGAARSAAAVSVIVGRPVIVDMELINIPDLNLI
jgi:hypothetical protein